jgi:hypothetical protein
MVCECCAVPLGCDVDPAGVQVVWLRRDLTTECKLQKSVLTADCFSQCGGGALWHVPRRMALGDGRAWPGLTKRQATQLANSWIELLSSHLSHLEVFAS